MVSQIVAVSQNGVIGNNNRLPWYLPEDLARFKRLTMGKSLIMGKNTYLSLPKKLIGRRIVVLSKTFQSSDVEVCADLPSALALLQSEEEILIAGGSQVYHATMDLADKIYLTLIKKDVTGDSYYPLECLQEFQLVESINGSAEFDYSFMTFERIERI